MCTSSPQLLHESAGDALLQTGQLRIASTLQPSPTNEGPLPVDQMVPLIATSVAQLSGQITNIAPVDRTYLKSVKLSDYHHITDYVKRGSDSTTLFYHIHIPKTGGTTVANLLLADICDPFNPFTAEDYPGKEETNVGEGQQLDASLTHPCKMGLTDNMLSCYPDRHMFEHRDFAANLERSQGLMTSLEATRIVYVTSLRRGSDRLISQWAHEVVAGLFVPPSNIAPWSNESLQVYVNGGPHSGKGWIQASLPDQRNNLQVAELASMKAPSYLNDTADFDQLVTEEHLDAAKQVLLSGEWLIGSTHCMSKLHDALTEAAEALHGFSHPNRGASVPVTENKTPPITLDEETQSLVDSAASFDNELYAWAWDESEKQTAGFVGAC